MSIVNPIRDQAEGSYSTLVYAALSNRYTRAGAMHCRSRADTFSYDR